MIKRLIVVLMLIVLSAGCGGSSAARGQLDSPLARIAQRHGVPAAEPHGYGTAIRPARKLRREYI
jgi:hypothetical protein